MQDFEDYGFQRKSGAEVYAVGSGRLVREDSVLNLLLAVCAGSEGETGSGGAAAMLPPTMEAVLKQLMQLSSTTQHVPGGGKNGVKACSCIVHLVLLQVHVRRVSALVSYTGLQLYTVAAAVLY